jgi:hypothetical protein
MPDGDALMALRRGRGGMEDHDLCQGETPFQQGDKVPLSRFYKDEIVDGCAKVKGIEVPFRFTPGIVTGMEACHQR